MAVAVLTSATAVASWGPSAPASPSADGRPRTSLYCITGATVTRPGYSITTPTVCFVGPGAAPVVPSATNGG